MRMQPRARAFVPYISELVRKGGELEVLDFEAEINRLEHRSSLENSKHCKAYCGLNELEL